MKTKLLLLAGVLGLTGCANISFYSDSAMKNKIGVPLQLGKPYLVVAPGEKDKPVNAQVVVLPDMDPAHTIYAKRTGIIGSTEFSASWTNGAISALGAKADPKSDAFLTSLTGVATAMKALGLDSGGTVRTTEFKLYEIFFKDGKYGLREVMLETPSTTSR